MSVLNGNLAPRIVITYKDANGADATETIDVTGNMTPVQSFTPVFLVHELDDNTILKQLDGYQYTLQIPFDIVSDENIIKYARLTHQIAVELGTGVVQTGYESIELYPYFNTKPYYHFPVVLSDKTITLEQFYELGMKDFVLELESEALLDWVPLAPTAFTSWGNITERMDNLTSSFDTYDPPTP
jgi:hypothetical protein